MSLKKKIGIVAAILCVLFILYRLFAGKMQTPFSNEGLGIWLSAFLTLAIMSFLYKDNPFYKFAEHLFVGVSAAYAMVMGIWSTLVPNCFWKLAPKWFIPFNVELVNEKAELQYILPLILGFMLLCLLIPKISWLSRWAIAFIVAATAGTFFTRYLISDFFKQIEQTMISLVKITDSGFSFGQSFSAVFTVLGVICGLIYFFYSKEHKGWFGRASKFGIWILMVAFGASFGYTVMGRIALLVGRMQDLFVNWLHLIPKG